MMGGFMVTEAREGLRSRERCFPVTEKERAEIARAIDEFDFVSTVLKHKSSMMSEDMIQELIQQNDVNLEIITYSLRSLLLFDRITEN
jgi:hypothetical protein